MEFLDFGEIFRDPERAIKTYKPQLITGFLFAHIDETSIKQRNIVKHSNNIYNLYKHKRKC